jgi:hypothetical protein
MPPGERPPSIVTPSDLGSDAFAAGLRRRTSIRARVDAMLADLSRARRSSCSTQ